MNKITNNKKIQFIDIEVTKQFCCYYHRAHFCNLLNNLKGDQTH